MSPATSTDVPEEQDIATAELVFFANSDAPLTLSVESAQPNFGEGTIEVSVSDEDMSRFRADLDY